MVRVDGVDVGLHTIREVSDDGAFLRHPSPVLPAGTTITLEITGRASVQAEVVEVRVDGARSGYVVRFVGPPRRFSSAPHGPPPSAEARPQPRPSSVATGPPPPPRAREVDRDAPTSEATPVPEARPGRATTPPPAPTALVVDADGAHGHHLSELLRFHGHVPVTARTAARALELFETYRRHVSLALVDFLLPDRSGEELVRALRQAKPALEVHAVSAVLRSPAAQRVLIHAGARSVLPKPTPPALVHQLFAAR